jgi:hypothetical protein
MGKSMISEKTNLAPDIEAEILPGRCAAGFKLGDRLSQEGQDFLNAKEWNPPIDGQLVYGLSINQGWLKYPYQVKIRDARPLEIIEYFYGNDIVRLHFRDGVLVTITVGDGYLGMFNSIAVGTNVDALNVIGKLSYDDIEEVYFFLNDEMKGIAFQLDEDSNVVGIIIHDESIQYGE